MSLGTKPTQDRLIGEKHPIFVNIYVHRIHTKEMELKGAGRRGRGAGPHFQWREPLSSPWCVEGAPSSKGNVRPALRQISRGKSSSCACWFSVAFRAKQSWCQATFSEAASSGAHSRVMYSDNFGSMNHFRVRLNAKGRHPSYQARPFHSHQVIYVHILILKMSLFLTKWREW